MIYRIVHNKENEKSSKKTNKTTFDKFSEMYCVFMSKLHLVKWCDQVKSNIYTLMMHTSELSVIISKLKNKVFFLKYSKSYCSPINNDLCNFRSLFLNLERFLFLN